MINKLFNNSLLVLVVRAIAVLKVTLLTANAAALLPRLLLVGVNVLFGEGRESCCLIKRGLAVVGFVTVILSLLVVLPIIFSCSLTILRFLRVVIRYSLRVLLESIVIGPFILHPEGFVKKNLVAGIAAREDTEDATGIIIKGKYLVHSLIDKVSDEI